jgi:hypothetical protein
MAEALPAEFPDTHPNNEMSAGDAGLIITVVALLLCLRCRRTTSVPETADEKRAEDEAVQLMETWREGL